MKKKLLYLAMMTICVIVLSSCGGNEKKYKHFAQQFTTATAAVDVLGNADMAPDRFYQTVIGSKFDKSDAQRTEDGIVGLYKWKDDNDYQLSDGEDFFCCAIFDFKRNPRELTLSNYGMVYKSTSLERLNEYYSVAMSELEPLMARWGFTINENISTPNKKFYLRDKDAITVDKSNESVTISMAYSK